MRDRLMMLVAIVLLGLVAATSYWYSRSIRKMESGIPAPAGTPDFWVEHVVFTQFDADGRAENRLFAEQMTHYPDNDEVRLRSPRLVSLRPDRPQVQVTARTAVVENAGERIHLQQSVVVTREGRGGEAPMRVTTEYLLALPDKDLYSTDRPVEIERGAGRTRANQMVIDNIARTLDAAGSVRTTIPPRAK